MNRAEEQARYAHRNQGYNKPGDYADEHLAKVVQVLKDAGFGTHYQMAGWLHDIVEDTPWTKQQLDWEYSDIPDVSAMVWAVTGEGETRMDKVWSIYHKVHDYPKAAIVKVADRIANLEASGFEGWHYYRYLDEAEDFNKWVAVHAPLVLRKRLYEAYGPKYLGSRP